MSSYSLLCLASCPWHSAFEISSGLLHVQQFVPFCCWMVSILWMCLPLLPADGHLYSFLFLAMGNKATITGLFTVFFLLANFLGVDLPGHVVRV